MAFGKGQLPRGGEGGGQIKIQNLTLIGLVQLNI